MTGGSAGGGGAAGGEFAMIEQGCKVIVEMEKRLPADKVKGCKACLESLKKKELTEETCGSVQKEMKEMM